MTTTGVDNRHTFAADDSGISCVHCGLPEPNVRHQTPVKVVEALQREIDLQSALLAKFEATLLELRKDQLYWSIVGQAQEDGLVDVLPVWLYLLVNVSTFQGDDINPSVSVTLNAIRGMDGRVLYVNGEYDDGGLAWDVFIDGMHLEPNDYVSYCFKVKPNAERSTNRAYLSMDYVPIEVNEAPLLTDGDSTSQS